MINVFYLMEEQAAQAFVQFKSDLDKLKSSITPDLIDRVKASIQEIELRSGQTMEIENGIARIPISGTLTSTPEECVSLSDGSQTLFGSIIESIKIADADHSVNEIHFIINSPGGFVDGTEQAAIAIRNAEKPTTGIIVGMGASAAYWLGSQCNHLFANGISNEIGSIGVLVELIDTKELEKKMGVKRIVLTSENAPDKFPDIGTKAGRDKIIARLNNLEKAFHQRVAEGRGISEEKVRNDFGRGGIFTSKKALEVGMIDGIINDIPNKKPSARKHDDLLLNNGNHITISKEVASMSVLEDLLKNNPEAKKEYDKLMAAKVEKPAAVVDPDKVAPVVKVTNPILTIEDKEFAKKYLNNEAYKTVGLMAADVLVGDLPIGALKSAIAGIDHQTELQKSTDADKEQGDQKETPAADIERDQITEKQIETKALSLLGIDK